jgi:hypothetical protein
LNLVQRWFREPTDKALRRRAFHSVPDPIASIQEYIDSHNDAPRPYICTATAESIHAKVARGRIALEKKSTKSRTHHQDTPLVVAELSR